MVWVRVGVRVRVGDVAAALVEAELAEEIVRALGAVGEVAVGVRVGLGLGLGSGLGLGLGRGRT